MPAGKVKGAPRAIVSRVCAAPPAGRLIAYSDATGGCGTRDSNHRLPYEPDPA
jgi:hypothetical protein